MKVFESSLRTEAEVTVYKRIGTAVLRFRVCLKVIEQALQALLGLDKNYTFLKFGKKAKKLLTRCWTVCYYKNLLHEVIT